MDIDQKDLTYHYYHAIKLVDDLINIYFDLLTEHHKTDATSCRQVCVIKAKVIEINLLRRSGYKFNNDELFKTCQTILWGGLQVYDILHSFAIDNKLITNINDEPKHAFILVSELKDLINTIKYLEAKLSIVHDYEQYFKEAISINDNAQQPTPVGKTNETLTQQQTKQASEPTASSINTNNNQTTTNQSTSANNQAPNVNQQTDHPVRLQAKQVEQWLLNHFPSRQEYMDLAFELRTISNKLDELEQLIKTKKKPN